MDDTMARFETFGPLVAAADVPALVRAGRDVWSFQYGQDDHTECCAEDEGPCFTTIQSDDLWVWDELGAAEAEARWGPFRVS